MTRTPSSELLVILVWDARPLPPVPMEATEDAEAGMRAIGRAGDRELREHGAARGGDGLHGMPSFEIYWAAKTAPPADATVVDRVAVWQIWLMLRPLHQMAFLALAAHGDYAEAARAVGYPYSSFASLISEARAAFLALWHEGETPSRIWATDRHGTGDLTERARRVVVRRKKPQAPQITGRTDDAL